MLQIVTGMYFRDVELRETKHRAVFYTNGTMLHADDVEWPIGRFLFSDRVAPVTAVTIEAIERLEAVAHDGESEMLVSTGGDELLNDVATVFAFALNLTCSRNIALVDRLVPRTPTERRSSKAARALRRTFDPGIYLQPEEISAGDSFCLELLALRRSHFEAAIRAIRRVVDATYLVDDDPSLAYTLFVSALESLAQISTSPEETRSWDTYDSAKRKVIDDAITDLAPDQANRVRDAVLKIDQLSLARRFRSFVLDHIEPSYFRAEAIPADRPIRAYELDHALRVAYEFRSRNVHQLEVLAPELWLISDRSDTLRSEGRWVLSLEGLNRLSRHVIRNFVKRSLKGVDPNFNYRDHLPGRATVHLAPQYWIWKGETFTPNAAPSRLNGLIELLLPPLSGVEENEIPRMDAVLERIEGAIPHEAQPAARRPMVAIYILWHTLMGPDHYRPDAAPFMERYQSDLDAPSMEGFVVRVLTDQEIEWLDADLVALVNERREDQRRGRGQPLPAIFDVALLLCLGQRLWDKQPQEALSLISEAVELVPGTDELIELERAAKEGDKPAVDLRDLVIASQKARSEDSDIATSGEAANDRQERAETTPQKTRATTENNAQ